MRFAVLMTTIWLTGLILFSNNICAQSDSVQVIPPGVSFVNLTDETWFALSRRRMEAAVINTELLKECEKTIRKIDNKQKINQLGNRIREGVIIALVIALVVK